ncbi:MAG: ion transporter [Bacteroidia bacterium]|nr:ion transporter [Bacteroidia bacterium]
MRKLAHLFTHDRPVAIVISLNAILLFFLSFDLSPEFTLALEALDAVFLLFFLLEALFKIRGNGWRRYIRSGWNRFDLIILILSIPSFLLLFESQFPNVSILFVFRVIRMVRFFKFIKFIPNIKELIAGVRRAFHASIFVLLAFFIYSFVISLVSCRMFKEIAPEQFGDPLISFYNIFKIFTIEGWFEVPEELIRSSQMGPVGEFFTKLYFITIVVSGGLFGLSIVNAIFVEEMVRDNNDNLVLQIEEINRKLNLLLEQNNPSSTQSQKLNPPESPPFAESADIPS